MKPFLPLCAAALALLATTPCLADEVFPVDHHEPLTVRVLNGKTGKPQPGAHILLTGGYRQRDIALALWQEEAVTDASGGVQLSDALKNLPLLQVLVLKAHACGPNAASAFSVERIRLTGMSTANRCASVPDADTPGVFNISVKPGKTKAKNSPRPAQNQPESPQPAHPASAETARKQPAAEPPLSDAEIDQLAAEQN